MEKAARAQRGEAAFQLAVSPAKHLVARMIRKQQSASLWDRVELTRGRIVGPNIANVACASKGYTRQPIALRRSRPTERVQQ